MTKDRLKEEIGFYKLLMTIASAFALSLSGWFLNNINYHFSPNVIFVLIGGVVFWLVTFSIGIEIIKKIKELDL